jgi:putative transposase
MIEPDHPKLSVKRQCALLGISRSSHYYRERNGGEEADLEDMKLIVRVLEHRPFMGYRKVARELQQQGLPLSRKRVRRLMHRFGLHAVFPGRNLSGAAKGHKKYPYLLRGKQIRYPNQVWASDLTYIRLPGGHVYLVAIMDLYSRKVLSFRLSNTLDTRFCVEALQEALDRYGEPAIFNTDQGSQFTSDAFVQVLESRRIRVSMDGKGRALDNVYVERMWRSLKYEDIYLNCYQSVQELSAGVERYFRFYNCERFHQSLEYETPEQMYQSFVCVNTLSLAA